MQELRLVPAAAGVWITVLAVLTFGIPVAVLPLALLVAGFLLARQVGQSLLIAGLGAAAVATSWLRLRTAQLWQWGTEFCATLSATPRQLDTGGYLLTLRVPGYPGSVALITRSVPADALPGASVSVDGRLSTAKRLSVTYTGEVETLSPPHGMAALAAHVRATFAHSVAKHPGGGLIQGMVLGDTSLQSSLQRQDYINAGLSHLSAVSGSNVAIVTTAAVLLAAALRFGLRARMVFAAVALCTFAALVGPEPSVLRASLTGLVSLVAVVSSSRADPAHTLGLAVIALILVDTTLATSFGFALSVAATAGIVALSEPLARTLGVFRLPHILNKAFAVAIAADAVTMPLIALMAGKVSLVAVAANVLVAPVVAPVTILGLIAVVLSLLPGGVEHVLLLLLEPLAWWIDAVARTFSHLPGAVITASPLSVIVVYGWVLVGLFARRPRVTLVAVCALVVAHYQPTPHEPDPTDLVAHVVATEDDVEPVPPGTEIVVVLDTGPRRARPVVTQGGIPVIYPNRG